MAPTVPQPSAGLTFVGTVQDPETAQPPPGAADRPVASVVVDSVIDAPAALEALAGQHVTVLLGSQPAVGAGEQAVFAVNPVSFGESIVAEEVEHHRVEDAPEHLMALAEVPHRDVVLQQRLDSAPLVVSGRVAEVRPVAAAAPVAAEMADAEPEPVSEHDPHWMEAVIEVDDALKGEPGEQRPVLVFPASLDVVWARAPKLHEGQEGVFALHPREEHGAAAAAATDAAYVAPSPADVQPAEAAGRISEMLG